MSHCQHCGIELCEGARRCDCCCNEVDGNSPAFVPKRPEDALPGFPRPLADLDAVLLSIKTLTDGLGRIEAKIEGWLNKLPATIEPTVPVEPR